MKIKIPSRNKIPECELHVEILHNSSEPKIQLGSCRPVMLMLPGGPGGNHTVYDEIKYFLLKYADLVLVDPRGCGLSTPSEVQYCQIKESVFDIEALRRALGIKKFILFGGSYGAMVSLCYAIKYSKNLDALILVAGAPSGECFNTAIETLKQIGTKEQIEITEKLFSGKIGSHAEKDKYYALMRNIYLAKTNTNEIKDKDVPTVGKRKLPYFLELSNFGHSTIFPNYNIINDLHKITVPTLLLAGRNDWIHNVKYAYQMNALIPNSELVIFPEAGHFVWYGIEEQFFEKIDSFISRNVPGLHS